MNHFGGVRPDVRRQGAGYEVVCDTCDRIIARTGWLTEAYEAWARHLPYGALGPCRQHPDRLAYVECNGVAVCQECLMEAIRLYYESEDPPDDEEVRFL